MRELVAHVHCDVSAIHNVIRQLRPLRSATIAINGAVQTFPAAIPDEKQALINTLTKADATH